jgi:hypothetical protein
MTEPEKKDAGSPFHLAEGRALPAAEWVWRENRRFPKSNQEPFAAQFVLGEDPGDRADLAQDASRTDHFFHIYRGQRLPKSPPVLKLKLSPV